MEKKLKHLTHIQDIHRKGQYFTKNEYLKESVFLLIKNKPKLILEPSMGRGDLVDYIQSRKKNVDFALYEIDRNINMLDSIDKTKINYGDFLLSSIDKSYDTIVGNPPYVKTSTGNLYLDFIEKCYNLLNTNGELIFIVPSDFIKLTRSGNIIDKMMTNGTFTHIIHPNSEALFDNASIDVVIFRYCKNASLSRKIMVNDDEKYLINTDGILTYSDNEKSNMSKFSDYFSIYVGMVTGKESVFKNNSYGNVEILNGKDKIDKYILLDKFPSKNKDLNEYLLSFKTDLMSRKIKKCTEKNWFEWGALRNYETIKTNLGKDCIYVSNLTRSEEVCFERKVQYFGGSLLIMIPKQTINTKKIVDYINSDTFKSNYMYSGRFKIGHKQLCNCLFQVSDFI